MGAIDPSSTPMNACTLPAPVTKKQRLQDDVVFCLTIENIASFRQLVDVIGGVLKHVEFTLTPHPSLDNTVVLSVDSIDPQHVCMVQSRLSCSGVLHGSSVSFCIDTETLMTCLRNIRRHHTIELSQRRGQTEVCMHSIDGQHNRRDLSFELTTYDDSAETLSLDDLDYEYVINVNMPDMKTMFKMAKDLKCDDIRMEVFVDKNWSAGDTLKTMVLQVSSKGDAAFKRLFVSSVVEEGSNETQSMQDTSDAFVSVEDMKMVNSEAYTLDYMIKFLKNMDQPMITMKMGTGLPILLHYDLGVDSSFVRFVLAPKTSSD